MIYETAVVLRSNVGEDTIEALKGMVGELAATYQGEVLLSDDWGVRNFAQSTTRGIKQGRYVYFMVKSNGDFPAELVRRYGINENILKHLVMKIGEDSKAADLLKNYGTPYSKTHNKTFQLEAELGEEGEADLAKDRKMFARKKTCWFTARRTKADWKDPGSYSWLLNEFGKISPARVTGLCAKQQRWATHTIKKARQMGLISYLTGRVAQ